MTRDEHVNYLRIALGLQKIGVNNETADRLIETYEAVLKLKGKFSIDDAVDIEVRMDIKYKEIELNKKKK